ncbi:hypothetical protein ACE5NI_18390 [Clostridioides difficile]
MKIYLNQTSNNSNDLCRELLQKLDIVEIDEGAVLEIIAPANPFATNCIKLKSKVAQKLLELRVKFIIRIDTDDK